MTDLTLNELALAESLITLLQKAVATPSAEWLPIFNHKALSLRAYDVHVPAGERLAHVPVVLSEPANQTMVVKYLSRNGTAAENSHFRRAEGYLIFHPGEWIKTVPVALLKDLGPAKFELKLGWPQNGPPITIADSTAVISGDPAALNNVFDGPILVRSASLPQRPVNMALIFDEDFTDFHATDSGYLADGVTPCWRTRLGHHTRDAAGNQGRIQPDNKEMGYYADATLNPGATPFFKDADGRLVLQSEYFPNGVLAVSGAPITCPWDASNPFYFTSTIITTQRNMPTVREGDFIEAKMTMCRQEGSWPAFWLIASDLSWPSIELDLFEGFFANPGTLGQVGTTVHWKDDSGGHAMFSLRLPQLGIDISAPHVWGMYWGEADVTFYCDDVPYMAVPNVFPAKDCYLKFDVTVGGLVGLPPSPATSWPAQMPIEWVRVWR